MNWSDFSIEHLRYLWNQHRHGGQAPPVAGHAESDLRYTQGMCTAPDASDQIGPEGYVAKAYIGFKLAAVGSRLPQGDLIAANPIIAPMNDQAALDALPYKSGLQADLTSTEFYFVAWFTGIPDGKVWGTQHPNNFVD